MLDLKYKNSFKKAVRKVEKRGKNIEKLWSVIEMLQNNQGLPLKYRNHKLSGEWKDFWECHIEPDWLLIYQIQDNILLLTDTGTHSDLFE